VLHYSLLAAVGLAVLAFVLMAPGRDRFNWQFGLTAAAVVFVTAMILSRSVLKWLRQQRLGKFNDQLEEALLSMSNALKAGFSINQAVEMVVKQNNNPISLEFKLMIQQTQLGMSFDDALRNMARRVQSEDFTLVASAISTARQTGGDLTGVFARLAAMIRERLRIQRRIRVLTAQGRLQGTVLGLLPMALLAILYFFVDPELVRNFFGNPIGLVLFGVVVLLEACGYLVIRKIVNIDI
jgi:tight adherence protein B